MPDDKFIATDFKLPDYCNELSKAENLIDKLKEKPAEIVSVTSPLSNTTNVPIKVASPVRKPIELNTDSESEVHSMKTNYPSYTPISSLPNAYKQYIKKETPTPSTLKMTNLHKEDYNSSDDEILNRPISSIRKPRRTKAQMEEANKMKLEDKQNSKSNSKSK